MKIKFKNLTLLTLLITALPFISFSPVFSMDAAADAMADDDADLGDGLSVKDGDLQGDDLGNLSEDQIEAVAKYERITGKTLKLEDLDSSQVKAINEAKASITDQDVANARAVMKADNDNYDVGKINQAMDNINVQQGPDGVDPESGDPLSGDNSARLDMHNDTDGAIKGSEGSTSKADQYKRLKKENTDLNQKANEAQQNLEKVKENPNSTSREVKEAQANLDDAEDRLNENRKDMKDLRDTMTRGEKNDADDAGFLKRAWRGAKGKVDDAWSGTTRYVRGKVDDYHDWSDKSLRSQRTIEEQERLIKVERPRLADEVQDVRDRIARAGNDGEDTTGLEDELNDKLKEQAKNEKAIRKLDSIDKRIGRNLEWAGKGALSVVRMLVSGFVMLLGQALAFTVPSALYQMTVAKENRMALLETIGDAQPFGNLWLQIPPQLIDQQNPANSAYLYCEVPNGTKQSSGYFNSQFLRTANFYVTGAPQQSFWGTSYIGGSQFNGQMVCLNNGYVFVGTGEAANYLQPTQSMIGVIEPFASGFVTKTSANTFTHTSDALDYLRMDSSSLMSHGAKNSFNDPIIKAMLLSPMVRQYAATGSASTQSTLPGTVGGNLPPPLFYKTIAAFRSPTDVKGFGTLQLRQMEGTGFLNIILNNSLRPLSSDLKKALKSLAEIDQSYKSSISFDGNKVTYGEKEKSALRQAQSAVANALGEQQVDTPEYGFSPDANLNAYNLYVYEIVSDNTQAKTATTVTPSLHGLLRNNSNSYVPLKEYVVCLSANKSIVPLLVPRVVKGDLEKQQKTGKGKAVAGSETVKGYTLKMVPNPDIVYISSLTTGLTYQKGDDQGTRPATTAQGKVASDTKLLTPYLDGNGVPDNSMATYALQQIERLLMRAGSIGERAMSQIVAMAKYSTDAAVDGPFTTYTNYTLTRVPLTELLDGDAFEQQENSIKDMGDVLSQASSAAQQNALYTSWNKAQKKEYLSRFYVYKVTKSGDGVLGKNGVPDYVVPVGGASTGKFEILPLGLDQMTGSLGTHGVQGLFSLITGRGYDTDYEPLPLWYTVNMHPLNRGSFFSLNGQGKYGFQTGSWVGEQQDQIYVEKKGPNGPTRSLETIRVVPNVYMGTAFMPGYYNPVNRMITDPQMLQEYNSAKDAVLNYGVKFSKLSASLGGLSAGTKEYAIGVIDKYGAESAGSYLMKAGFNEEQVSALMGAKNLEPLEKMLSSAQERYNTINSIINKTPRAAEWKSEQLMINVPPLYFLFFTGFSFCSRGGQSSTFSPTGQEEQSGGAAEQSAKAVQSQTVQWPMTQPCKNATTLVISHGKDKVNGSLMSVLPEAFSGFNLARDLSNTADTGPLKQARFFKGISSPTYGKKLGTFYPSILAAYTEWSLSEDRNNYWVQSGFMGPFNYTQRQYGNVYITATSRQDVANGNFFYHASGFPQTDIFVCALGPEDGNVKSIDQLHSIGRPYTEVVAGKYLINVGTGQVYTPYIYPGAKGMGDMQDVAPYACFSPNASLSGNECSLQPVGQSVLPGGSDPAKGKVSPPVRTGTQLRLSPQEILAAALTNQGDIGQTVTTQNLNAAFANLSSGLQGELNTALQSAQRQIQKTLYPVYFGGLKLRLSLESVNKGTYIYALTPEGQSYDSAHDYLVVTDMPNSASTGGKAVTPYTKAMLSLVTGTLYLENGQSKQNYLGKMYEKTGVGREQSVPRRAMELVQTQNKVQINVDLAQRIIELNTQYINEVSSLEDPRSLIDTAPIIPIAVMEKARTVTEPTLNNPAVPSSNLIQVGGKYFLKAKTVLSDKDENGRMPTLYTFFDFNATSEAGDSNVGVYYAVPTNPKAENLVPTSAMKGFELEAMRAAHGVVVEPNGEQSLTIPVTNVPLPLAPGEKTLIPGFGQDGYYMKLAKNVAPAINREKGEKYYYYYHRLTQAYYVLVQDMTGTLYGGGSEDGKDIANIGYFVDLMSGDEYYVNGQPRMIPTVVAYPIVQGENKQEVVDVEMPIFVWGEANNSSGQGQNLNALANTGQGYTQYMYVPFTSIYRFQNAQKQTMYIGYETKGEGASQEIIPVQKIIAPGSQEGKMQELNLPKGFDTQGMTEQQKAEVAFVSAVEAASQRGWALYEIEYKLSASGMAYDAITLTSAAGDKPRQYQFGSQRYIEGGIQGFKYPLAQNNMVARATVYGRPFVGMGMGNREGIKGIPQGTPVFGSTLCGILENKEESMLAFVPTINPVSPSSNTKLYFINQGGLPRPGQMAQYQAPGGISIPGLVTDYSVTGQKSRSGVAVQSSYVALGNQQVQAIYGFGYSYASKKDLAKYKDGVNVISNAEGNIQLVQEVDRNSKMTIQVPKNSIGSYLVGFSKPTPTVMYRIPPLATIEEYYQNDKTRYNAGKGNTMSAIEMFNNAVLTFGVGTYVDYSNGAIYEVKKGNSDYLYPNGYSVGGQGLSLIRQQFSNAQVQPGSLKLISQGNLDSEVQSAIAGKKSPPKAPPRAPVSEGQQYREAQQSSGSENRPMVSRGQKLPQQDSGSRGTSYQGPPAPPSRSTAVRTTGQEQTDFQQQQPAPRASRPAPEPPSRSTRFTWFQMPEQPLHLAVSDLKNRVLTFINTFFTQSRVV